MNKVSLRKFALYSREKLEKDIKKEMNLIGITEKGAEPITIVEDGNFAKIGERYLSKKEIEQRKKLVEILDEKSVNSTFKEAFDYVAEEIAYTWFNRIVAIRFMEVNDYFSDNIKILSSERKDDIEPQIIREVFNSDLKFTESEKDEIYKMKENNEIEKLFKFLFIKKCNSLNEILPELFEKIEDYTELLLTISIIDKEGVIQKLVNEVEEENFRVTDEENDGINGQVEVIGWIYQYYNEEKKKEVVGMNKGVIKKEDIPVATQIFTTDWVVRYIVENSLGKYWIERNRDSKLKEKLQYFVTHKNGEINYIDEKVSVEDIKFLEPCMGSGHILVYAFDILMKIYREEGYSDRDAVRSILENNLYGLDVDKRAYQLTYFALMMKAREYDRRFFSRNIDINVNCVEDSNILFDNESQKKLRENSKKLDIESLKTKFYLDGITIDETQNKIGEELIRVFEDGKELGSLIKVGNYDYEKFDKYLDECSDRCNENLLGEIWKNNVYILMKQIVKSVKILNNKYNVVCTNPPYLNKYNTKLKNFVEANYKSYKGDLFSVFMKRVFSFLVKDGYSGWMTPNVWLFIKTYEELRKYIVNKKSISSLIQIAKGSFYKEATVDVISFVLKNGNMNENGIYIRLEEFKGDMEFQKNKVLEGLKNKDCKYIYETSKENFKKIPGSTIGYWASENLLKDFEEGKRACEIIEPKQGLATADNDRFLRQWYEINSNNISYNNEKVEDTIDNGYKWYPYNKGGARRQWYGNYDYVVNWENDGNEIRSFVDNKGKLRSRPQNTEFYFKNAIAWSDITSSSFSIRYREKGSIHDVKGMSAFSSDSLKLKYILGVTGTKIANHIFKMLNPTVSLQVGDFSNFPVIENEEIKDEVIKIVDECIKISKYDWNSFETSWDFAFNPLVNIEKYINNYEKVKIGENGNLGNNKLEKTSLNSIEEAYNKYKEFVNSQFLKLQKNEEKLNEIFIKLYGLENELTSDVSDRNVTITKIFDCESEIDEKIKGNSYVLTKEDVVKQFISYAVGCMFGRYSLDYDGLIYAGGQFLSDKYDRFVPDEDNCVPITDSEYFEDDIVNRLVSFVKEVYGEENLAKNIEFISKSLGNKGEIAKDTIREYFVKNFYDEHVKRYKKRPIYWQYDSGKKNGFKGLVYVHRYEDKTTAKVRLNYLHRLQKSYEIKEMMLREEFENNKKSLEQELKKIKAQLDECKIFDEKLNHLSLEYISINLDDGIKVNFDKIQTGRDGKKYEILRGMK